MMKRPKVIRFIFVILIFLFLSACQAKLFKPNPGNPASNQIDMQMDDAIAQSKAYTDAGKSHLPKDVQAALLPTLALKRDDIAPVERFDIHVSNMPAREFFLGLVKDTPYNIVVGPKVTGEITLDMKKATIPGILEAVRDIYGYQYSITDYGIFISEGGMETRTFRVNYLDIERSGQSSTSISSGQLTQAQAGSSSGENTSNTQGNNSTAGTETENPVSYVKTAVKSDFWAQLQLNLDALVKPEKGGRVLINPEAGIVMVRALPSTIRQVAKYLDVLQSIMNRQVIIEAKILQITLSKGYQAGVDWSILGASQDASQDLSSDTSLKQFTNIFTLNMHTSGNDFSLILHLLSNQGNIQVLSSPRVATLNNQKALIKVGTDQYFVTNLSSTTNNSGLTTDVGQDVDLTPFFSGIALDVTPEINGENQVILHIHPVITKVLDNEIKYKINGEEQEVPSALNQVRESDSIVRARSGQIIVIGGLMEDKSSEYLGATPFLSNIPFFGTLFRRTNQLAENTELVILLRPIVVNPAVWTPDLEAVNKRFKALTEGFHFGSHPNRFGNLGEYQNELWNE